MTLSDGGEPETSVGEVTQTYSGGVGTTVPGQPSHIAGQFEKMIAFRAASGYRLRDWKFSASALVADSGGPGYVVSSITETIIAVFERATMATGEKEGSGALVERLRAELNRVATAHRAEVERLGRLPAAMAADIRDIAQALGFFGECEPAAVIGAARKQRADVELLREETGRCSAHGAWNAECSGCLEVERDGLRDEVRGLREHNNRLLRKAERDVFAATHGIRRSVQAERDSVWNEAVKACADEARDYHHGHEAAKAIRALAKGDK